jgi:hypothetical protein
MKEVDAEVFGRVADRSWVDNRIAHARRLRARYMGLLVRRGARNVLRSFEPFGEVISQARVHMKGRIAKE